MSKSIEVDTVDDLDGSSGARTVQFSLDGRERQIDLSPHNEAELRGILAPFILAGRRQKAAKAIYHKVVGFEGPANSRFARLDRTEVRKWAREEGMHVPSRGRISYDILRAYYNAFPEKLNG